LDRDKLTKAIEIATEGLSDQTEPEVKRIAGVVLKSLSEDSKKKDHRMPIVLMSLFFVILSLVDSTEEYKDYFKFYQN